MATLANGATLYDGLAHPPGGIPLDIGSLAPCIGDNMTALTASRVMKGFGVEDPARTPPPASLPNKFQICYPTLPNFTQLLPNFYPTLPNFYPTLPNFYPTLPNFYPNLPTPKFFSRLRREISYPTQKFLPNCTPLEKVNCYAPALRVRILKKRIYRPLIIANRPSVVQSGNGQPVHCPRAGGRDVRCHGSKWTEVRCPQVPRTTLSTPSGIGA